jgi:hypothetical protein
MTTIYKHVVPKRAFAKGYAPGSLIISHPGHRVRLISAGLQDERRPDGAKTGESSIVVWYEATAVPLGKERSASLHLFYTGDVLHMSGIRHLATLQHGELVYHLYT